MSSWRDGASPQAQQDLDSLLDTAIRFAEQQLTTRGAFFPYAVATGNDGEPEMIAARPDSDDEHPPAADVLESCVAALDEKRADIRACALVADVRVPELGGDAVRVELEHAEGQALTVLLPYRKKRLGRGVDFGDVRAQAGSRRIWA
jgi:hypothetical protein